MVRGRYKRSEIWICPLAKTTFKFIFIGCVIVREVIDDMQKSSVGFCTSRKKNLAEKNRHVNVSLKVINQG